MNAPSITGSDSFRARIQRSESDRALLTCAIYALLILLTIILRNIIPRSKILFVLSFVLSKRTMVPYG